MGLSDRLFPHDLSAEESVIGSLLIDDLAFSKIAAILEPEHFYMEANRLVFEDFHLFVDFHFLTFFILGLF